MDLSRGGATSRGLEAGPLLVGLGAVLLLVSLFLSWFTGEVTAWQAFEVWDVVLFVLALAAIAAGLGLATQDVDLVDRRSLPVAVAVVAVIVASQIIDPPPAAIGQDPDLGAWLALGAALLMCAGAVLTFGRVHLALTVERRDQRRHVSVVDARGSHSQASDQDTTGDGEHRGLFARPRAPETAGAEPAGARAAGAMEPATGPQPARAAGEQDTEEK